MESLQLFENKENFRKINLKELVDRQFNSVYNNIRIRV